MAHVSDIKLIRTDTTLDLSQKAEKGMLFKEAQRPVYSPPPAHIFNSSDVGLISLENNNK
ncbi:unnamed protein product [Spirodela intermedia]|uniref:Uncharacterized protein n=1 Tax=Spirodela intermedia TaxID=51605 RepID=A0A7I8JJW7_SPIIN|nr:unnamed protein product [Spirodela intermedia]CAA6670151.1 unnamed protein product [Spirodela intermedia]